MEYAIIETPNYFPGTCGAPQEHYIKNIDLDPEYDPRSPGAHAIVTWETREEAEEAIENIVDDGPYYLSHGEAGRPSYKVVDLDEEEEGDDDCYPGTGEGDCTWEEIDPDTLPDGIQAKLGSENVEWSSSCDDYDIYEAVVDGDENEPSQCDDDGDPYSYRIVFCPRSTAIERNSEDLGNVNWDNPGYYRGIL